MCDRCDDGLGVVPVEEGDVTAKLCLSCTTDFRQERPDVTGPAPDFLADFLGN